MSKAVEGAALLGGALLDGAAMFIMASSGVGIAALPFMAKLMTSLALGGIALEAGAVAQAIVGNPGMPITIRQTAANRQIIYGQMRVGGVIIYESTTGSSHDQRNFCIVLASHVVDSLVNAYLDGRQVYWQASGVGYSVRNGVGFGGIADGSSHTGPDGQQYNFGGTGHSGVYFEARYGDHLIGDVFGSLNANDPNWGPQTTNGETWGGPVTSTNPPSTPCPWIGGCCAVYMKLEFNTNVFPTDPSARFTVRGKNNIYDPRIASISITGSTTASSTAITSVSSITGVKIGAPISGAGIPAGATVAAFAAGSITLDSLHPATATATGVALTVLPIVWTTNAALIIADVLMDPVFGLGDSSVNIDQLIAAANVCDETISCAGGTATEARYTCNCAYDTSLGVGDILSMMLDGCAGRLSRIGGEWYIWPAYFQGASFSFDESSIAGTGPLQWTPNRSTRELFNRVRGTYIAPNYPYNVAGNLYDANGFYNGGAQNNFPFAYQPSSFPEYAADPLHGFATDAYTIDDGRQLVKEINLRTVLSVSQAQRVAKIMLMRNRQQGSGTFQMHLKAFAMQPTDVMQFTFAKNGWTNKLLEVVATNISTVEGGKDEGPSIIAQFSVQETDPSVYDWDPTTDELSVYDVPSFPGGTPRTIAPPTSLTLSSSATTAVKGADGIVTPRILASWTAPADVRVTQIQVQHSPHGAGTWVDDGAVDAATTSVYISGVVAGSAYDVRIRSLALKGQTSVWVETDNVTVGAPNSLQSTYANNPAIALTQPTSTTIHVASVAVSFGTAAAVTYAARTLTITAPSVATVLYVTIADPTQQGESGSPTLTATVSTTQSLVGVIGNTYMGSVIALPAGSAIRMGPGGWPVPASFQVVP